MNQLEAILNEWFAVKAPQLPESWKKFIVTVSPWLAIIGVVLGAIAAFALFSAASSTMALIGAYGAYGAAVAGAGFTTQFWLSMAFMVAMLVLEALSIPGLRKRTYNGWKWMYYASILSLVQGIVSMNFVSAIIGAIIGFYILFQVRSHYSGAPALPTHPSAPSQPHQ
jgi:hypothetical protein